MLPTALIMLANERRADSERRTLQSRINRTYLDKERQPRILRHWTNR